MPDGVAAKGRAKAKVEKAKNEKPKIDKGRAERKPGLFSRLAKFIREAYIEVAKKAAWPSWDELKKFTAVVIFAVVVMAVWIGGLDYVMTRLTRLIGMGVGQ